MLDEATTLTDNPDDLRSLAERLELGEVPPFDECYAAAQAFYRELPWDGG